MSDEFDELLEEPSNGEAALELRKAADALGPPPAEPMRNIRAGETEEEYLIAMWGEEAYFDSAFYKAKQIENERQARLEPVRKAFLKARA